MVSLTDLAVTSEVVAGVTVGGVSARGVSYLISRFPQLRALMTGNTVSITAAELSFLAPEAIGALIAVGCGYIPDGSDGASERQMEAETKASLLPVATQADFLDAIIRLTMPGGVGPFVKTMERLGAFVEDGFMKGQVTNSQLPSSKSSTTST